MKGKISYAPKCEADMDKTVEDVIKVLRESPDMAKRIRISVNTRAMGSVMAKLLTDELVMTNTPCVQFPRITVRKKGRRK